MKNVLLIFFLFLLLFGCDSKQTDRNAVEIKKIKTGMSVKEVRELLGTPNKIRMPPLITDEVDLIYSSPFGYSDNFHIFISKRDSTVIRIGDGL